MNSIHVMCCIIQGDLTKHRRSALEARTRLPASLAKTYGSFKRSRRSASAHAAV